MPNQFPQVITVKSDSANYQVHEFNLSYYATVLVLIWEWETLISLPVLSYEWCTSQWAFLLILGDANLWGSGIQSMERIMKHTRKKKQSWKEWAEKSNKTSMLIHAATLLLKSCGQKLLVYVYIFMEARWQPRVLLLRHHLLNVLETESLTDLWIHK